MLCLEPRGLLAPAKGGRHPCSGGLRVEDSLFVVTKGHFVSLTMAGKSAPSPVLGAPCRYQLQAPSIRRHQSGAARKVSSMRCRGQALEPPGPTPLGGDETFRSAPCVLSDTPGTARLVRSPSARWTWWQCPHWRSSRTPLRVPPADPAGCGSERASGVADSSP